MRGQLELYELFSELSINFEYHEHPPAHTAEEALKYWEGLEGTKCKNLFFRNHKGNRHYLVIIEARQQLAIRDLEQRLKQGKISFASEKRMDKYLGLKPGSVSPFGLINDEEHHVHIFLDRNLKTAKKLSFHPNINTASLVIENADLMKLLDHLGNSYEFIELY